jgi:hypothetical protein
MQMMELKRDYFSSIEIVLIVIAMEKRESPLGFGGGSCIGDSRESSRAHRRSDDSNRRQPKIKRKKSKFKL